MNLISQFPGPRRDQRQGQRNHVDLLGKIYTDSVSFPCRTSLSQPSNLFLHHRQVLGKGDNIISPSLMMPAGVPQAQSPSLQRQSSHHSSLAAVVLGMMQASKRNNIATTRKLRGRRFAVEISWFKRSVFLCFSSFLSSCLSL